MKIPKIYDNVAFYNNNIFELSFSQKSLSVLYEKKTFFFYFLFSSFRDFVPYCNNEVYFLHLLQKIEKEVEKNENLYR
jgi:hypothetical protein